MCVCGRFSEKVEPSDINTLKEREIERDSDVKNRHREEVRLGVENQTSVELSRGFRFLNCSPNALVVGSFAWIGPPHTNTAIGAMEVKNKAYSLFREQKD